MKVLLSVVCVLLLCSCASAPQVGSYVSGTYYSSGPTSPNDPRMRSPQFYMDDSDGLPAWAHASPRTNR